MTMLTKNIQRVIKDFKGEIKENRAEIKLCVRDGDYASAAHLNSVNGALDYVIDILKSELNISGFTTSYE